MSDKAAPTLLQRVVMWILHAVMFYVVALYPVYLMAGFQPDDVVHYGFLRWMAVVLILYWTALQLFFTQRPGETRVGRMLLAVTAAVLLVIGTFTPMVSVAFIGGIDYFREGYGDGYILLIMAGLSAALAVTGRWKQVLVPALGSLAVILWTFLGVQDTIAQVRSGAAAELTGNPHAGLAASVMQSIQLEWGWVLLFAGSGLLVYSAARRDRSETVSPPLASVAVEDEPEAVPAETAEATATEAEITAAEEATTPAEEAPDSARQTPDEAASAAGPTEAAPETPAESAEAATAAAPEEPVPVAQPAAEETATAPATAADADEPKADGPDAAPAAEAPAGESATGAAKTDVEESATAETAPAPESSSTPADAGAPSTDGPASDAAEPTIGGASPKATASAPDKTSDDAAKK